MSTTQKEQRQPRNGSGKTHFNRIKSKGQSWTGLRDRAIANGEFQMPSRKGR